MNLLKCQIVVAYGEGQNWPKQFKNYSFVFRRRKKVL